MSSSDRRWPLPEYARDLVDYLYIEDERTHGQANLPADRLAAARDWLVHIVLQTADRMGHIEELKRHYGGELRLPRLRRYFREEDRPVGGPAGTVFRHHDLMPEARAMAVAEKGVEVLDSGELARLLLNPFALLDLADLIDTTLPDYWLDLHEVQARETMKVAGVEALLAEVMTGKQRRPNAARQPALRTRGSPAMQTGGSDGWPLSFESAAEQALQSKIAEHLYGDGGREFELRLFWQVSGAGLVEFELEVALAPTRNDLTFTLCFPSGQECELTVEVPHELKVNPGAKPRERTRSDPSEPLAVAACRFDEKGEVQWGQQMPPRLRLPSVQETA